MLRRALFASCGLVLVATSPALFAPPARGQGLRNVVHSGARVFPGVGPGVTALKRDSAGRYYVLAQPANRILLFDATGKSLGQIPNANSGGATIRYAVDIDLDSRGRLFVVDRGANAVKIFAPDGALVSTVHVFAPTSIVALSDDQFAVTTLQSSRLVQIMNQKGAVVRSFGDPADQPGQNTAATTPGQPPAESQPVVDRGRIAGDSAGNIYFSFTSLPDPTLQKYDRFGYSAYEAVVPADKFVPFTRDTGPVEFGVTMSAMGWPAGLSAWTDLHSLSSLSLGQRMGRGQRGQAGQGTGAAGSTSGTNPGPGQVQTQGNALAFTADADDLEDADAAYTATAVNSFNDLGEGFIPPGAFGVGLGGFGFHGHMPGGPGADDARARPPEEGAEHYWHGHPGMDFYRASAAMRVNLDTPVHTNEKPVISAVGVDPETQDAWAAVGDTLVHFDKNGNAVDMYYLALQDEPSLKPTAILVEPSRLLIAADPWGIYEFPRPDKTPLSASPQLNVIPRQIAPANATPSRQR
jgi:hypothetical protein